MTKGLSERRLRIPVQFIDGAWECKFGGPIPIKPGAHAELIVNRASVSDSAFLKTLEKKDCHKVLDEGASLLVGLTVKPENPPPEILKNLLRPYSELWKEFGTVILEQEYSYDPYFVEIHVAGSGIPSF